MTDENEPLERKLREALGGLDTPRPDPAARRRAIALARSEFDEARGTAPRGAVPGATPESGKTSQGIRGWLRLIVGKQPDKDRAMIPISQKLLYPGVAAAAVAAIAVGVSLRNQPALDLPEIPVSLDSGVAEARYRKSEVLEDSTGGQARGAAFGDPGELASVEEEAALQQAPLSAAVDATYSRELALVDSDQPAALYRDVGRDKFEAFEQNTVKLVSDEPVSTFSADVDTASYSFVRRMLNQGVLPQDDAVRAEEMINYFDYDYPLPKSPDIPFEPTVAVSDAPWAEGRKLMHIGIKGFDIAASARPRSNLVFLLDVSGSMNGPDRLPLVKQSMELLLTTLDPDDTVAIAVYAGAAGTVLEPTPVREKQKILDALRRLSAGGSTAGAQGIRLAYELAESRFDENAVNRVILATDGDFNVGITDRRELESFISRQRERGIFLSVLGFGQGNYRDAMMQTLAQSGNGVAAYIDTLSEARKLLVDEATSTLFPIARDVKLQVEFNPAAVAEYRLVGYETRHLNREDFNNDAVDAGDIGAGHTVTAIYEFTPVGSDARQIEESRYAPKAVVDGKRDEYAFLKIRYKLPEGGDSRLISRPVTTADRVDLGEEGIGMEAGFATAVAAFAQILKGSRYTGDYDYEDVIELARKTRGEDPYGYRTEFIQLVRNARTATAMQAW